MTDDRKVYLVASGEYSDYRIDSVWSDEGLAAHYAEHIDGGYVDERDLRSELPALDEILTCQANMLASGEVFEPTETIVKEWADRHSHPPSRVRLSTPWHHAGTPQHLEIQVKGTDHVRVRKVMGEVMAFCKPQVEVMLADDGRSDISRSSRRAVELEHNDE